MNSLIQSKTTIALFLVSLVLACVPSLQIAQAVVPPPDGGYPGGNTAEGQNALLSLSTGTYNTAVGLFSLLSNTDANFNTGVGAGTLLVNTAPENTATGAGALLSNTTGASNTANGAFALFSESSGDANTAVGDAALLNLIGGSGNVAIGVSAGGNIMNGIGNVYLGAAMAGIASENNHTYIRNINTTTVSGTGTDTVTVDLATGMLGHLGSSRRYKENINPMGDSSQALYRLKPVTYRFKKEIDRNQSTDYGLIAEDVAQVDPNLAIRDGKGQIESVRYNAVKRCSSTSFCKSIARWRNWKPRCKNWHHNSTDSLREYK